MTSGTSDDGPVPIGTALCDQLGAMHIVYGILASLYWRERSGIGQRIDVSLLKSALAFQAQDFFTIQNLGEAFQRPNSGIAHPGNGAPFGVYRTTDGFLAIAMNPWEKLVQALDEPKLSRHDDPKILFEKRDEIWAELQAIIETESTAHWLEEMLALDLWVAEVKTQSEVAKDPQVQHVEGFSTIEHPRAGNVSVTNIPIEFSRTPGSIRFPSPLVGEHGREVLSSIGYQSEQIDALIAEGTLYIDTPSNH